MSNCNHKNSLGVAVYFTHNGKNLVSRVELTVKDLTNDLESAIYAVKNFLTTCNLKAGDSLSFVCGFMCVNCKGLSESCMGGMDIQVKNNLSPDEYENLSRQLVGRIFAATLAKMAGVNTERFVNMLVQMANAHDS